MARAPDVVDLFVAQVRHSPRPIRQPVTKIGGAPVLFGPIEPPACTSCRMPMAFLAQVRIDGPLPLSARWSMAYIFMCAGAYDSSWALICENDLPDAGANRVVLQAYSDSPAPGPGATYPDYAVRLERAIEPRVHWTPEDLDVSQRKQLWEGTKVGGVPAWLRSSRRPACPACGGAMIFAAQFADRLEPSPDGAEKYLGFGEGGRGYLFLCAEECGPGGAAFLYQC
ncbi:MAG: hypothetical protein HYX53_17315 [Chloroflexi bacterium]|nr:hypothetical protein [Chloroflexota bacterium]